MLRSAVFAIAVLSVSSGLGADFYVATDGSDTNPGTEGLPWKTIQKGADSVPAGSRIFVKGGVYSERITVGVSGSAGGGRIEFLNYPGEVPVVDGTGFDPSGSDEDALVTIRDQSFVTVSGFELRSYRTALRNRVPIGILIGGNSDFISILDNKIHQIETNYAGLNGGDAHGIAVFGDDSDALEGVVISGNELYDLRLGSSEALVLNGNVTDFTVSGNIVHDCNNIGIDFIGFEGTAPTEMVDQARDGMCSDNIVYNIDASHNPAYGGDFSTGGGDQSADGIYVDGGTRIIVERNIVHHCNIGIELASEHSGKSTSEIILRNNLVYQNDIGGIFMGGYDTGRGSTESCRVANNTLYLNDVEQDGNGEIYLQYDVRDCAIENNILVANAQGLLVGNPFTQNTGNTVNYNLFHVASGGTTEWQWKTQNYSSFAAYQNATGNDTDSVPSDPRFQEAGALDWHLLVDSPARNAGNPVYEAVAGETDLGGYARVADGRVDMGCYEFGSTPPVVDVPSSYRPDLQIGGRKGGLLGNNVYNSSAVGQTVNGVARRGWVTFNLVVENDGGDNDSMSLHGSGGNRFFKIAYFGLNPTRDITSSVRVGYEISELVPGAALGYQLRVKAKRKGRDRRKRTRLQIGLTSVHESNLADSAAARIRAK